MTCIFDRRFVVLSPMNTYVNHPFRCFTCTVTLMALLWLTIGFAFAYNHSSTLSAQLVASKENSNKPDTGIPFENTGEEKAEVTSGDFVSEYVKTDAEHPVPLNITINYNRHYTARAFVNFCCDSVSPPPETSGS